MAYVFNGLYEQQHYQAPVSFYSTVGQSPDPVPEKKMSLWVWAIPIVGLAAVIALVATSSVKKSKKKKAAARVRKQEEDVAIAKIEAEERALEEYEKKHPRKPGETVEEWNYRVPVRWINAHDSNQRESARMELAELRSLLKTADYPPEEQKRIAEKIRLQKMGLKPLKGSK